MLYAALFVGEVLWSAIVPLVPAFATRLSLSPLRAGVLLASASVAIVLVSVPAGWLGERLGARRVTLAAIAVIAVADAGQGTATTFWQLVAARTLFGVGFGVLWTTGVAWLSEAAGDRQSRALSLTVTTAGVGGVAGPAFAGALVPRAGLAAPFLVAAAVTAALAAGLGLERSGTGLAAPAPHGIAHGLRAGTRDRRVTTSLVLMALGGLFGGVVNLLVPLQLHRNGVATGSIGAAFAVSAVLFIASSAGVAHLGDRATRAGVGAVAATAAAAALALVVAGTSTGPVVGFLLVRAPIAAVLFTVTVPLGVRGAQAAGIGVGTMAALLNIVWATSQLVAPIGAGALAQTAGDRAAYGLTALLCLAVAGWIAGAAAPAARPALEGGGSRSTRA
jgi:predicted MFS family arabinose efflux permease